MKPPISTDLIQHYLDQDPRFPVQVWLKFKEEEFIYKVLFVNMDTTLYVEVSPIAMWDRMDKVFELLAEKVRNWI